MISCSRAILTCAAALIVPVTAIRTDAAEETFAVDLRAERTQIKVADPVEVTLSATAPKGWRIRLPEVPVEFGELKVIEAVNHLQEDDGMLTASTRLKLESLLPGRYQIGPLDVRFIPENAGGDGNFTHSSKAIQRSTRSLTIRVYSALGFFDSRQPREIYGTVGVPWTWRQWTLATLAIVAAFVFGSIAYQRTAHWLRSQRTSQQSLLEELDQLDEARLNRSISNDRLVVSIADVVRRSLQLAEGARPVYRTTEEWIHHLRQSHVALAASSAGEPKLLSDTVELVLREADAIKFAGRSATLAQARRCLDAARRTVRTFLREKASTEDGDGRP